MIDMKIGTIFGVGVGFEILTRQDFESINHEALGAIMISLFCVRVTFTRWLAE